MMSPANGSERTTHGVRVRVTPQYHPERSDPGRSYWFFSYSVEIANLTDVPVRLLARHWEITDATGKLEEVDGPGVVGEQPRILPGKTYQYMSFCPLQTPIGSMQGWYRMKTDAGDEFDAAIGTFVLEDPSSLN